MVYNEGRLIRGRKKKTLKGSILSGTLLFILVLCAAGSVHGKAWAPEAINSEAHQQIEASQM